MLIYILIAFDYMALMAFLWMSMTEAFPNECKETLASYLLFSFVEFPMGLMGLLIGIPYLIIVKLFGLKSSKPPE